MKELVFLLEEESAKAMLESLLPRLLGPGIHPRLIAFEGKQDLEKQIARKMRGYLNPQVRFIVMRDQDATPDCRVVKRAMISACRGSGREGVWLVRIACRELESIYLADLAAVESELQLTGLGQQQNKAKFRAPDTLQSPGKVLSALTKNHYQKVGGSRAIGRHLALENVRSKSFKNLVSGIRRLERELLELDP